MSVSLIKKVAGVVSALESYFSENRWVEPV